MLLNPPQGAVHASLPAEAQACGLANELRRKHLYMHAVIHSTVLSGHNW